MTQHEFEVKFKVEERNPDKMTATDYDYYCHAQDIWNYLNDEQRLTITVEIMDDIISEYEYLLGYDYYWVDAVREAIQNSYYDPDEEYDEECTPSATNGDYGPSNPWDAPGMKTSDFI